MIEIRNSTLETSLRENCRWRQELLGGFHRSRLFDGCEDFICLKRKLGFWAGEINSRINKWIR